MIKYFLFIAVLSCSTNNHIKETNTKSQTRSYVTGPTQQLDTWFVDQTQQWGLANTSGENQFLVDFNQDGYLDWVLIPEPYAQPQFYLFMPKEQRFQRIKSLLPDAVKASYLLFYDFNSDDVLDVLVVAHNQKLKLRPEPMSIYWGRSIGQGLEFGNKTIIYKRPLSSVAVAALDFDRDGDLDLFVANWFDFSSEPPTLQHDVLLENQKGKFIDRTASLLNESKYMPKAKIYPNATPSFGVSLCDINNDHLVDVLTTSTHRYPNKMWINQTNTFQDVAAESGYAQDTEGMTQWKGGGNTFFSLCADYNDDGLMDIFVGEVSHDYDGEEVDRTSLLEGKRVGEVPHFWRTEKLNDIRIDEWHQSDKRALWADFNMDGQWDLWVDNTGFPPHTRAELYQQSTPGQFINVSEEAGINFVNPQQTLWWDINGDAMIDLISLQSNRRDSAIKRRPYVFVNRQTPPPAKRRLIFELIGEPGNRMAVGAKVMLKLKRFDQIMTKHVFIQHSFGPLPSQQDPTQYIYLASSDELLSLEIVWPSGPISKRSYNVPLEGRKFYLCQSHSKLSYDRKECFN